MRRGRERWCALKTYRPSLLRDWKRRGEGASTKTSRHEHCSIHYLGVAKKGHQRIPIVRKLPQENEGNLLYDGTRRSSRLFPTGSKYPEGLHHEPPFLIPSRQSST